MPSAPADEPRPKRTDPGWCLCLSGGGFRATLFHLGAVRRLNELGVLGKLATVTSVSGGSILNGVLATRWRELVRGPDGVFTNFNEVVGRRVRDFCGRDLRTPLLVGTRLHPGNLAALIRDCFSVCANFLADGYEPLFRDCPRLRDLPPPGPDAPRFVFCSTNVVTGACWHFHNGPGARMGDFYTGYCGVGDVRVAEAVAASSAFPPGFSGLRLRLPEGEELTRVDPWGDPRPPSPKYTLPKPPPRKVLLTDGGVYDNLGVETIWEECKTLFASDAGHPFDRYTPPGQAVWARLPRAAGISMEQVAAVRKRWLVDDLTAKRRAGALWAIDTRIERFLAGGTAGYGPGVRPLLHRVRTDLNPFTAGEAACLENHGYSLADASVRSVARDLCPHPAAPFRWPHDEWHTDDALRRALAASDKRTLLRDAWRFLTGRA